MIRESAKQRYLKFGWCDENVNVVGCRCSDLLEKLMIKVQYCGCKYGGESTILLSFPSYWLFWTIVVTNSRSINVLDDDDDDSADDHDDCGDCDHDCDGDVYEDDDDDDSFMRLVNCAGRQLAMFSVRHPCQSCWL